MVDLSVFTTVNSLHERIQFEGKKVSVGCVPTMGALHHGHLALVKKAMEMTDLVVVTIFVNPKQFNKSEDLVNYPRTLDRDVEMLNTLGGNLIVFAPSEEEVYPADYKKVELELGLLEEVMEGEFRPGHFDGVVNVVKRLFDIVQPSKAFFGEKDFQQLAVINFMVSELDVPVEVIGCPTVRENSGLASSSRNMRLTGQELIDAEIIFQTMEYAKGLVDSKSVAEVLELAVGFFEKGSLELEYLEIVDPVTLENITNWVEGARMCIAANCGAVRLIDNAAIL